MKGPLKPVILGENTDINYHSQPPTTNSANTGMSLPAVKINPPPQPPSPALSGHKRCRYEGGGCGSIAVTAFEGVGCIHTVSHSHRDFDLTLQSFVVGGGSHNQCCHCAEFSTKVGEDELESLIWCCLNFERLSKAVYRSSPRCHWSQLTSISLHRRAASQHRCLKQATAQSPPGEAAPGTVVDEPPAASLLTCSHSISPSRVQSPSSAASFCPFAFHLEKEKAKIVWKVEENQAMASFSLGGFHCYESLENDYYVFREQ
ncbi:zinc finger protein [Sesbania bispinosa]|nr:zinc finger protein [Sesbania bispinosa]